MSEATCAWEKAILNWDTLLKTDGLLLKIGSLAGLVSFIWLFIKDIGGLLLRSYKKPRLEITFDTNRGLRVWDFSDKGWQRKFANLHIRNKGRITATRCVATLKVLEKPNNVNTLEDEYALHWADIDYTNHSNRAQPVDVGHELTRLDIVFTQKGQNMGGCWIAAPYALNNTLAINQFYLPPGEYKVKIEAKCENGKGNKAKFKLISPENWQDLSFEKINLFAPF